MVTKGRLLAFDYGSRKIGIAVTDPLQITASPLKTVRYHSKDELGEQLATLLQEYEISRLIVGIPYTLSGGESETTSEALEFATWLEREFDLPVEQIDESLTSRQAMDTLHQMGVKTGHNKERVDAMAASHLLRHYLDMHSGEKRS